MAVLELHDSLVASWLYMAMLFGIECSAAKAKHNGIAIAIVFMQTPEMLPSSNINYIVSCMRSDFLSQVFIS